MDVHGEGIPHGVLRESGCIYTGPANGGVEQIALGNMVCKHMAFKGLQVETQTWVRVGWWWKAGRDVCLGVQRVGCQSCGPREVRFGKIGEIESQGARWENSVQR